MEKNIELAQQEELQNETAIIESKNPDAKPLEDVEWCFQFFNNEPIVFAWSNEGEKPAPLTLQLMPVESEGLSFQQNGMTFRIYPQAISEETKKVRAEQNEADTNTQK